MALAPWAPVAERKVRTASPTSTVSERASALGIDLTGSLASSAASGTPSTPRKNHMPKGKAAQMPRSPKGSQDEEPSAPVSTGMSSRRSGSKSVNAPTAKTSRATTATAVTIRLNRSASPTPQRWMPMKTAKQAR